MAASNPAQGTSPGLQEFEILVHVFYAPNDMFAYTIVHYSPCIYYKDINVLVQKVNLQSVPLTINPEPSLTIQTVF